MLKSQIKLRVTKSQRKFIDDLRNCVWKVTPPIDGQILLPWAQTYLDLVRLGV